MLTRDDIGIHLTCELVVDGATWPCFSHTIEHPDGLVLVDTGMTESTPELDEIFHPIVHRLPDELVERVAQVIITHMHFDHHGANRLFPGIPIHVQRIELEDARTQDDYTIREWIDFPSTTGPSSVSTTTIWCPRVSPGAGTSPSPCRPPSAPSCSAPTS